MLVVVEGSTIAGRAYLTPAFGDNHGTTAMMVLAHRVDSL